MKANIFGAAILTVALAAPFAAPLHAGQVQGTVSFLDAMVSDFGFSSPYLADLEIAFTGDDAVVSPLVAGFPGHAGIALSSLQLTVRRAVGPDSTSAAQSIAAGQGYILTDFGAPLISVVLDLPDGDPELDLLGAVVGSGAFGPAFLFDESGADADATGVLNANLIGRMLPFFFPDVLAVTLISWGAAPGGLGLDPNDPAGPAAFTFEAAAVPLPAAAPLLIAGLGGLVAVGRRRAARQA